MRDMEIIGLALKDEAAAVYEINRKYGSMLRQTLQDVFGNNADLIQACMDNINTKLKGHLFLYKYKVTLPTHLNAQVRNEIVTLLRTRRDLSYLSNLSDIAIKYCREQEDYSDNTIIDSSKIKTVISGLSKTKVEFLVRRYYYLKDKSKILDEMKLTDNKFEKMENEIEQSFGCNSTRLVDLIKGIELKFLEEYNNKVNSKFSYDNSDKVITMGTAERKRNVWLNKKIIVLSIVVVVCYLLSVLLLSIYL
jgi:hypothetical protein